MVPIACHFDLFYLDRNQLGLRVADLLMNDLDHMDGLSVLPTRVLVRA